MVLRSTPSCPAQKNAPIQFGLKIYLGSGKQLLPPQAAVPGREHRLTVLPTGEQEHPAEQASADGKGLFPFNQRRDSAGTREGTKTCTFL